MSIMSLPQGKTCADCNHFNRCSSMFGTWADRTECDFYPIFFSDRDLWALLVKEGLLTADNTGKPLADAHAEKPHVGCA